MEQDEKGDVLNLSPRHRFKYFLTKAADLESLWGLYLQGWAMATDGSGRQMVAFWPEEEFASDCAHECWTDYQPRKLEIEIFLRKWIPGMKKAGVIVAVFPMANGTGIPVEPESLARSLQAELTLLYLKSGMPQERQEHLRLLLKRIEEEKGAGVVSR